MICEQCQEERSEKDFYQSTVCYKCTFRNKMRLNQKKETIKRCKICNNPIPTESLIYWKASYCSEDCAREGKNQYNKAYWIHNCNAPKVQRGFQYGKPK